MKQEAREKITEFTDLIAWQKAHHFVLSIYEVTEKFPAKEQFGLTNQMRRAAVSITSNIAEGFGRPSYKEKIHFYYIANGSLTEIKNQLWISKDVHFITETEFDKIINHAEEAHRLLQGLITKSKSHPSVLAS